MAVEHLTDSILQNYLDNNISDNKTEFKTHLDSCSLCQARLEQYKLLYTELEIDSIPELSPNFSNAVMSKIALINPESSVVVAKKQPMAVSVLAPVFTLVGIIAAIASIIYFIDLGSLVKAFNVTAVSDYFNRAVISKVGSATADLGSVGDRFDFSLVLMVLATLAVIGGIDYIVRQYKHRTASFMV